MCLSVFGHAIMVYNDGSNCADFTGQGIIT